MKHIGHVLLRVLRTDPSPGHCWCPVVIIINSSFNTLLARTSLFIVTLESLVLPSDESKVGFRTGLCSSHMVSQRGVAY
jgi:hypothetical protein